MNAEGGEYGTALKAAAYRGYKELVELLLDRGVDVNVKGGKHGTALQAAALYPPILQLLEDEGAK